MSHHRISPPQPTILRPWDFKQAGGYYWYCPWCDGEGGGRYPQRIQAVRAWNKHIRRSCTKSELRP